MTQHSRILFLSTGLGLKLLGYALACLAASEIIFTIISVHETNQIEGL